MTNEVLQDIEAAAAPEAIAVIQAIETFNAEMGTNPAEWPANYIPAKLQVLATVTKQFPVLASEEIGALDGAMNSAFSGIVTKLQAVKPATTATGTNSTAPVA